MSALESKVLGERALRAEQEGLSGRNFRLVRMLGKSLPGGKALLEDLRR